MSFQHSFLYISPRLEHLLAVRSDRGYSLIRIVLPRSPRFLS